MIDPPTPFCPTANWEAFLRKMETLPQANEQVAGAVREAREILAERGAML
jgi:hypothetical protein